MDYDAIVQKHGFPGPAMHLRMYQQLKERAVRLLIKRNKTRHSDKVMIATGIRHDESERRSGYVGQEVSFNGAAMWVNPLYWWTKSMMADYVKLQGLRRNPVSEMLGMSGECLCGAYAHPGELAQVKIVCPETHARIIKLQELVMQKHPWGWEDKPPTAKQRKALNTPDALAMPFCHGCEKNGGRTNV